jgi:hypothetical protein
VVVVLPLHQGKPAAMCLTEEGLGHALRALWPPPLAELRRKALVAAGVRTTRALRRCIGAPANPARAAPLEHEQVGRRATELLVGWLSPWSPLSLVTTR